MFVPHPPLLPCGSVSVQYDGDSSVWDGLWEFKDRFLFLNSYFFCLHEIFVLHSEISKPFILVELSVVWGTVC